MDNKYEEAKYNIMRTAFLTAFPKIFTNINYAVDIFSSMKDLAIQKGFSFQHNLFSNEMAIEIEARHKALNYTLDKYLTEDTLIIEIAAGMSPRHLEYKKYNYVELDFEPVIETKKEIYSILGFPELSSTLYGLDITNIESLHNLLNILISKEKHYDQIIILNEGLFWYLKKENIAEITNEFKISFKDNNWIWITSDCPTTEKSNEEYRNTVSKSANVKRGGTFSDYNEFSDFFNKLELKNTSFKLSELIDYEKISSAQFFSFKEDETLNKIDTYTDIAILEKYKLV